jgi:hypothetical protein
MIGEAMRATFAALILLAAATGFAPAKADPYAWCALYYGDLSGIRSCYFNTREQCLATIPGIGGTCQRSPFYTGDGERVAARRAKPRS